MIEQKELLKRAIDAIEGLFYGREDLDREGVILTVEEIEKELAKPKPYPVAWCALNSQGDALLRWDTDKHIGSLKWIPLYTSQPNREPLSNKQMQDILDEWLKIPTYSAPIDLIRLTEKAHRIGG
jgi:hypothetical protein